MKANLLDAAIFNPLMYANSCKIADYKIIPELCLFSESYSELCSVYFKEGIAEIESLSSRFPDDYLIIIANRSPYTQLLNFSCIISFAVKK